MSDKVEEEITFRNADHWNKTQQAALVTDFKPKIPKIRFEYELLLVAKFQAGHVQTFQET